MFNVAMLSKWHVHAEDYARRIAQNPDAQVSCVWDENEQRGKEWADRLGARFFADLDELLKSGLAEGVCVDTPTNMHREVIVKSARAGMHIFTEKVLAFTEAEANEIANEVAKAGVKFCISFPHRVLPSMLYIKNAVETGMLGAISLFRVRNAHGGAMLGWLPEYWYDPVTTGGGAMMDLGAHPMYLTGWILGEPKRYESIFTSLTGKPVEDNAVTLMEFENGATAIAETSLASPYTKKMVEVYGSKGAIICENDRLQVYYGENGPIKGWVEVQSLPKSLPSPIDMWINGVVNGGDIEFGLKDAVALSRMMEGAYKAANK